VPGTGSKPASKAVLRDPTESCNPRLAVLIPIYKPALSPLEEFSVTHSLSFTDERECVFVAPEGLDLSYYRSLYPRLRFELFAPENFTSVESYSRLLLSPEFYKRFLAYEFILILQPDAILFRDDLDFWMDQGYDYIGAPWPDGIEITLWRDDFQGERRRRIRAHVGNGGLSLRRVKSCIGLMSEFPETHDAFVRSGTNEDSYFSLLGTQTDWFRLPDQIIASRFSIELRPEYYLSVNGHRIPMGSHGWSSVQPGLWLSRVPSLGLGSSHSTPETVAATLDFKE
jgi:hypothetical protein